MNKQTSFQPLLNRANEFANFKHDTTVEAPKLSFAPTGHLMLPSSFGSMALGMEDLALGQLGERLGRHFWKAPKRIIPTDFYRQLYGAFPQHFASLTNDLLKETQGKLLVRGYDQAVRAILSDQYATLDNVEFLDMASQVLEGVPYEIVESGKYYRDNDGVQRDGMTVRVIVKNVSPGQGEGGYGLGVLIRNGETGGAASEVRPLVMRTSCMNSLIFKKGEDGERLGLRLTHRGSRQAKALLLASAIAEALPMAEEGLERFIATKKVEIDLKGVIANLGKENNWSEELKLTIATGSEGYQSVFGLVNGITYAAHELEIDSSYRFDLESLASQFVYQPLTAKA